MRKQSDELVDIQTILDQIIPFCLNETILIQLRKKSFQIAALYKQHRKDQMFTSLLKDRIYNYVNRCHRQNFKNYFIDVADQFGLNLQIRKISLIYSPQIFTYDDPQYCSSEAGMQELRSISKRSQLLLDRVFLSHGCIPNLETLLFKRPKYLHESFQMETEFFDNSGILEDTMKYFLAICAVAQYGSTYMIKRLIKKFLQVGGDASWFQGHYDIKIKNILSLCHILAYQPDKLTKSHIISLTNCPNPWKIQQLVQATAIMAYCQLQACLSLATRLVPEDGNWDIPQLNIEQKCNLIHEHTENQQNEKNEQAKQESSQEEVILPLQNPNQKRKSEKYKRLESYQYIHQKLLFITFAKDASLTKKSSSIALQYSQYNFKFRAYPFFDQYDSKLASKMMNFVDSTKNILNEKSVNKQINNFHKSIRSYTQKLFSYMNSQYNSNSSMYFTPDLKTYIKQICFQPYLINQANLNMISHNGKNLSSNDLIDIALVVVATKFEYTMTMVAKSLEQACK